jgi:hypothetical protein
MTATANDLVKAFRNPPPADLAAEEGGAVKRMLAICALAGIVVVCGVIGVFAFLDPSSERNRELAGSYAPHDFTASRQSPGVLAMAAELIRGGKGRREGDSAGNYVYALCRASGGIMAPGALTFEKRTGRKKSADDIHEDCQRIADRSNASWVRKGGDNGIMKQPPRGSRGSDNSGIGWFAKGL